MIYEDENGDLVLTGENAKYVLHEFEHPDPEALRRRQAFLKEARECVKSSTRLKDGRIIMHIKTDES
ncbi:MAG: hypothetical protein ABF904_12510 [Ethanoligenens sp.]